MELIFAQRVGQNGTDICLILKVKVRKIWSKFGEKIRSPEKFFDDGYVSPEHFFDLPPPPPPPPPPRRQHFREIFLRLGQKRRKCWSKHDDTPPPPPNVDGFATSLVIRTGPILLLPYWEYDWQVSELVLVRRLVSWVIGINTNSLL